jgi:hypothetical protein
VTETNFVHLARPVNNVTGTDFVKECSKNRLARPVSGGKYCFFRHECSLVQQFSTKQNFRPNLGTKYKAAKSAHGGVAGVDDAQDEQACR